MFFLIFVHIKIELDYGYNIGEKMAYIKTITEKDADSQNNGGKIMGLAQLHRYGLPIPETFFIAPKDSANIKQESFKDELRVLLSKLSKGTKLAIRSSAQGEDGSNQSFAGIFETVLDVDAGNVDAVLKAINDVAQSVNSQKTASYAGDSERKMGIIIQEMIQPVFAGVAFTDALAENGKNVLLIEFVKGLGDKLVSGRANSSRITIPYTGQSLDTKNTRLFNGGDKEILPILSDLAKKLQDIKTKFAKPMDIEWAIDSRGKAWMLQARPITKAIFVPSETNSTDIGAVASYGNGRVSGTTYFIDGDLEDGPELDTAIKQMPNGAILVLTYSDTYYMPAMRKAKAIISTNGSILAHAAIVSRELNIPCFLGVNNADKLFPTGTKVTVDPHKIEILSDKVHLKGDNSDIDWGDLDIYDHMKKKIIDGTPILFETTHDNKLVAHLPFEADETLSSEVERFARQHYHKTAKQYKTEKYQWFFEIPRFQQLQLFNELLVAGKKASNALDATQIDGLFDWVLKKSAILVQQRKKTTNDFEGFILEETMRSLDFAASQLIASGYGIQIAYDKAKPELIKSGKNFVDLINAKSNEEFIVKNKVLQKIYMFLKSLERGRNNTYAKLLDIGSMRPDYFDDRDERAIKALTAHGIKTKLIDDAIDNVYSQLVLSNNIKKKIYEGLIR